MPFRQSLTGKYFDTFAQAYDDYAKNIAPYNAQPEVKCPRNPPPEEVERLMPLMKLEHVSLSPMSFTAIMSSEYVILLSFTTGTETLYEVDSGARRLKEYGGERTIDLSNYYDAPPLAIYPCE